MPLATPIIPQVEKNQPLPARWSSSKEVYRPDLSALLQVSSHNNVTLSNDGTMPAQRPGPPSSAASANLLSLTHNVSKSRLTDSAGSNPPPPRPKKSEIKGCPKSKYMFVNAHVAGFGVPGHVELCPAPCKSNNCPYCGRRKAWSYVHQIEAILDHDKITGRQWVDLFITFTVRAGLAEKSLVFKAIKKGHQQAIQAVRKGRKGSKRGGGRGIAFPPLDIRYANSMDVQENGEIHIHALYRLTLEDFEKLGVAVTMAGTRKRNPGASPRPGSRRRREKDTRLQFLGRYMWWFYARALYRQLGLAKPSHYTGSNSPGFVHVGRSSGAVNAAQYMALHNGKAWKQREMTADELPARIEQQGVAVQTHPSHVSQGVVWPYPHRYRLLTTSRGFFPIDYDWRPIRRYDSLARVPRANLRTTSRGFFQRVRVRSVPSDWSFIREGYHFAVSQLVREGIPVAFGPIDRDGVTPKSVTVYASPDSSPVQKWVYGHRGQKITRPELSPRMNAEEQWESLITPASQMLEMMGERQLEINARRLLAEQRAAQEWGIDHWRWKTAELERQWAEAERLFAPGESEDDRLYADRAYSAWLRGIDDI